MGKKKMAAKKVPDEDIEYELYEVCDRTHASCDEDCPVYEKNGSQVPWNADLSNCRCFKDGKAMLAFLRKKG